MLMLQKSNCNKHSKSTVTTKKSKQLSCFIYTKKFENSDQIEMILVLKDALKDRVALCAWGVTRGEKFPGPNSLWGASKSTKNVTSTFLNTVHLLPKDFKFEHRGPKLASCSGRHLSSLRPWYGMFEKKKCPIQKSGILEPKITEVPTKSQLP